MLPLVPPSPAARGRRSAVPLLIVIFLSALGGCATRPAVAPARLPQDELSGVASWYGYPYHGKRTASGEVYDMDSLTAAHRTLPFNSQVRVQRTDTGREVEVRINDRGPFVDGRVIDLSRAAARRIDLVGKGVAPVRLTPLEVPQDSEPRWAIIAGGFSLDQANRLAERLKGSSPQPPQVLRSWNGDPQYAQVRLLGYNLEEDARRMVNRLRDEGYPAFIVRTKR